MIVSGYTLELYCDHPAHDYARAEWGPMLATGGAQCPTEYLDPERGSKCRTAARKDGWLLKRDGTCICPDCRKESKWLG